MIVVDTSALVSILLNEPERSSFNVAIIDGGPAMLSAVSLQEAGMVLRGRKGEQGVWELLALLGVLRIQIVPYDEQQARIAIEAFARYGRGMGSRANLNMGDCASYALAKHLSVPLLYKGNDFAATDIVSAA